MPKYKNNQLTDINIQILDANNLSFITRIFNQLKGFCYDKWRIATTIIAMNKTIIILLLIY